MAYKFLASFASFAPVAVNRFLDWYLRDLCNPFFVAHVIHVNGGVALKLMQAVNGAEVERFSVIVMTGRGVGNADFHFANRIDRHGRPPDGYDPETGGNVS